MKIVLASQSPRRKEIMETAGFEFEIIVSNAEEKIEENLSPEEVAKSLSLQKAQAVAVDNPEKIVIGADTIVVLDNEILGKPKDKNDAYKMLKKLSGKAHKVYTGIEEMLKQLKRAGKRVILATSKPEKFALIVLEHFGLREYFDFVAGALMSNSRTKKDEVIAYALENIGEYNLQSTIMVGDRMHDVEGAAKFSIPAIGVTYGYGSRQELNDAGAKVIVDTVEQLTEELLK